jgi:hypothetical protein
LPTHYGFITSNGLPRIRTEYERLVATDPARLMPARRPERNELSDSLKKSVREAIDALDARGAWVEDGRLRDSDPDGKVRRIITTQTFMRNVETLSRFVAASN